MKPDNAQLVNEFLAHADDLGDDVMEDVKEMLGVVPFIFSILRDRPELVAVAAAAGAGADSCLKVHMGAALKEGASRDEILDALLIAAMIGKTRVLASSLRRFREVCREEQTAEK